MEEEFIGIVSPKITILTSFFRFRPHIERDLKVVFQIMHALYFQAVLKAV